MIGKEDSSLLTILHSLPFWLPLTAPWLYNQIRNLPTEVCSHIVCERTENLDQFNIQNIHSLEDAPRWRYFLDKGLRKLGMRRHLGYLVGVAKRYHAKILHSHWGDMAWRNIDAGKKAGLSHIVTFYGKDVNYFPKYQPKWAKRYLELFSHIDLVLCEGPHMAQCLAQLGCPENKIQVHHLGVDVNKIPFIPRIWKADQPLRVLIAASFREKKGIPYALEALGRLQNELSGLEITIIGDASEDPRSHTEKEKILSILSKYQLDKITRLLGYQPYSVLFDEAYKHHIFMSPSLTASDGDTEGGAPVTLIDMAATGIPIISTTHCDIPHLIIHGETGLLASERDVNGLLEHLRWFVANPTRWGAMASAGRRHIDSEYEVVKQAGRLRDIYMAFDC